MKRAEQVTFGGSGLDRAAHLRTETATLDQLWGAADPYVSASPVIPTPKGWPICKAIMPLWRGDGMMRFFWDEMRKGQVTLP